MNARTGHVHHLRRVSGRAREQVHEIELRDGRIVAQIVRLPDGDVVRGGENRGACDVVSRHPLHRGLSVIGDDDGTTIAQSIPEERFPIEGVVRTVNEGRAQGAYRYALALAQREQRAFGVRLLRAVNVGMIFRNQR